MITALQDETTPNIIVVLFAFIISSLDAHTLTYIHTYKQKFIHTCSHQHPHGLQHFPSPNPQGPADAHRFSHPLALFSACHMGFPFQVQKHCVLATVNQHSQLPAGFWALRLSVSVLLCQGFRPHFLWLLPSFYSLPTASPLRRDPSCVNLETDHLLVMWKV